MPIAPSQAFAHVRVTVTDIERSAAFYDKVFGWPRAIDTSASVDEPGVKESREQYFGGVVYAMPAGTLFGLRPVAPGGQRFDSERTGLDHVSFMVEGRDVLVAAHEALHAEDIPHGEITDLPDAGLAILSFSDPDGIHLELTAPLG